jgi:hypothetical protein
VFIGPLQVLAFYRFLLNVNLVHYGLQLNVFGLLNVNLVLSSSVFDSGLQHNMFDFWFCCFVIGFWVVLAESKRSCRIAHSHINILSIEGIQVITMKGCLLA